MPDSQASSKETPKPYSGYSFGEVPDQPSPKQETYDEWDRKRNMKEEMKAARAMLYGFIAVVIGLILVIYELVHP